MLPLPFILVAMFVGLLASSIIPYARKFYEGKIESFDLKYLHHLVIAGSWEFIASLMVYSQWEQPSLSGDSELLMNAIILVLAAAYGYGGLAMQKDIEKAINSIITATNNKTSKTTVTVTATSTTASRPRVIPKKVSR